MSILSFFLPMSLFTFIVAVFLSRNPVYGVLSFVVVIMHIVVLLISLDLEFLAYTLAIIYIGAIVVLFLFVVMMFYIHHFKSPRSIVRGIIEYYFLGYVAANLAYYFVLFDNINYTDFNSLLYTTSMIYVVAWYFFNDAFILTVLVALIMLIGIIGAITLAIKSTRVNKSKPIVLVTVVRNSVSDVLEKKK